MAKATATIDFINPCLNFQRTDRELELFFIFSIAVAGKGARPTKKAVMKLIGRVKHPVRKLVVARLDSTLQRKLEAAGVGKHRIMLRLADWAIIEGFPDDAAASWLRACTVTELEDVPGVGPKTARFFVLYSRPAQSLAVLDRHVLAWLRDRGHDAPANTPQSAKRYAELEKIVLDICREEMIAPAALDDRIWQERRR